MKNWKFMVHSKNYGNRVADEINQDFRSNDIIGRMGGDKFIIFAPYLQDKNKISGKAKLLLKHLTYEYENENAKEEVILVTASIGVEITNGESFSYTELYENADRALYASKRSGKTISPYLKQWPVLQQA